MFRKFLIAAFVLALASGIACADSGCPQVPETQGFATSTIMRTVGTVTETDSIVSQITSLTGTVNGQPSGVPPTPPLAFVDHQDCVDAYTKDKSPTRAWSPIPDPHHRYYRDQSLRTCITFRLKRSWSSLEATWDG